MGALQLLLFLVVLLLGAIVLRDFWRELRIVWGVVVVIAAVYAAYALAVMIMPVTA